MATVELKHIVLFEATLVQEHVYTLTGRIFAAGMLLFDGFLATSKASLFALSD